MSQSTSRETHDLPTLTRSEPTGSAVRAVALMLHGGKASSTRSVGTSSASWKRMGALQRAVDGALHEAGVATWLLRYRVRGWNGSGVDQISDARWALEQVRTEHPDVPIVLVGHSMGGRTAVHVADDSAVRGVVALAPWFDPGDPVRALSGKHLRAAHGRSDKITRLSMTRAYVDRARAVAASAEVTDMGRVGHYMFRDVPSWNAFTGSQALDVLGLARS